MESFLKKRDAVRYFIATSPETDKKIFLKSFKTKHRSFLRLPNGKKHGYEELYFWNGNVKLTRIWKEGVLDGLETLYDDEGSVVSTTEWKDNKRHGDYYAISAILEVKKHYVNGKSVCGSSRRINEDFICKTNGDTSFCYTNGKLTQIYVKKSRGFLLWKFFGDGRVAIHKI
uniref:MORN repeat containing protein n=1 Tax=Marseillevirus sp. TaxID=2809551 RepID=A0AA96ENS8_9VIRU|nr:MORN repeat containing protein [Marseillevirus sp.]